MTGHRFDLEQITAQAMAASPGNERAVELPTPSTSERVIAYDAAHCRGGTYTRLLSPEGSARRSRFGGMQY